MWDIKYLIKDFLRQKNFQSFINARFRDDAKVVLDKIAIEWLIYQLTGSKIKIGKYAEEADISYYKINEIQKEDVVLDIGAGSGIYSLLSAVVAKKVYPIEPLISDIAKKNIENSHLSDKIYFLDFAFGKNGETIICNYWSTKKEKTARDLNYILDNVDPNITVVKCDCEGGEWGGILPCTDFKKIRKIDMEYHFFENRDLKDLDNLMSLLHSHNFKIELRKDIDQRMGMLHAKRDKFEEGINQQEELK